MPWLLDGNNLAGGLGRGRVRQAALALARRQRVRVVVVFDGAPPAGSPTLESLGQVEVRYAVNADAAILELLGSGGSGWRLATDDRDLGRRAAELGAEVVGGEAFWTRLREEEPREAGGSGTTPSWRKELEYFRDPRNRLDPGPARVVRRPRRGRQGR